MTTERAGSGLYCFLDRSRACGPDCMSFQPIPEHKDFIGKQWAHCLLLVNAHRVGKHLTVLANVGDGLLKAQQDEARKPIPPPPVR